MHRASIGSVISISCIASPIGAVRETSPRRPTSYHRSVNEKFSMRTARLSLSQNAVLCITVAAVPEPSSRATMILGITASNRPLAWPHLPTRSTRQRPPWGGLLLLQYVRRADDVCAHRIDASVLPSSGTKFDSARKETHWGDSNWCGMIGDLRTKAGSARAFELARRIASNVVPSQAYFTYINALTELGCIKFLVSLGDASALLIGILNLL
jgi:hypothetical protein